MQIRNTNSQIVLAWI